MVFMGGIVVIVVVLCVKFFEGMGVQENLYRKKRYGIGVWGGQDEFVILLFG